MPRLSEFQDDACQEEQKGGKNCKQHLQNSPRLENKLRMLQLRTPLPLDLKRACTLNVSLARLRCESKQEFHGYKKLCLFKHESFFAGLQQSG